MEKINLYKTVVKITASVILISLFLFYPNSTFAKIQIATIDIPNLLSQSKNHRGIYNQLLDKISDKNLVYLPAIRTEPEFAKDYLDCLFPANKNYFSGSANLLSSEVVNESRAYLFYGEKFTDLNLAEVKTVAIRRGLDYGDIREKLNLNYIELNSDLDTVKFLEMGRVDGLIGYLTDIEAAYLLLGKPVAKFNRSKPIFTLKEIFICKDTSLSKAFLKQINQIIPNWKQEIKKGAKKAPF